jgi:hypothetical protein
MGKITMIINYKKENFSYFKCIDEKIIQGTLLDYGCNIGSFLETREVDYDISLYTGIDVLKEAIEQARYLYPKAEFFHFDDYNAMYNPTGIKNLKLSLNKSFDNIIAYSVFTHTTEDEMKNRIDDLFNYCKNKIYFSFCDIEDSKVTNFFYRKRIKDFGTCDPIISNDKLYLIDNKKGDRPIDNKMFLAFYNKKYLASLFPHYHIEFKNPKFTINFQTCAIVSKK